MNKRNSKLWSVFIWTMLLSVMVTWYAGYRLHYALINTGSGPTPVLLALLNALRTLLADPEIDAGELVQTAGQSGQLGLGILYAIFALVAAIATFSALALAVWPYTLDFLQGVRRKLQDLRENAGALVDRHESGGAGIQRVLLFGYNESTKILLRSEQHGGPANRRIHLVTADPIPEEEELLLLKQGVILHTEDCLALPGSPLKSFFRRIELDKADRILLMEDSATRNYSIYLLLDGAPEKLLSREQRARVRCYLLCGSDAARHVMEASYDKRISRCAGADGKPLMELTLFDLSELKANEMFERVPLHKANRDAGFASWDVHLVIAGFGRVGQKTALQAINRGVLTPENELLIDVYDSDIATSQAQFAAHFNNEYVTITPQEISILPPRADGVLRIRFHEQDLHSHAFSDLLSSEQARSPSHPITYAAICAWDGDTSLHCLNELLEVRQATGWQFPILVRLEHEPQVARELCGEDSAYEGVYAVPSDEELLRIDTIANDQRLRRAQDYSETYRHITLNADEPGPTWESLKMYKRRNNYRLVEHHVVKLDTYRHMVESGRWQRPDYYFGKKGIVLHTANESRYEFSCGSSDAGTVAAQMNQCEPVCWMAMTEHRRYCYVMAMDGWHYGTPNSDEQRHKASLVDWSTLCATRPGDCPYDLLAYVNLDEELCRGSAQSGQGAAPAGAPAYG